MRATKAQVPRGKESAEGVGAPQGLHVNWGGTFYPKPPQRQGELSLCSSGRRKWPVQSPQRGAGCVQGHQVTVPAESQPSGEAAVRSQAEGQTLGFVLLSLQKRWESLEGVQREGRVTDPPLFSQGPCEHWWS